MKSRLQRVSHAARAAWGLVVGARWLHDPLDLSRTHVVSIEPLPPWYYDLERSLERDDYQPRDSQGIPMYDGGLGPVHHPTLIASYSIANASRHVFSGDPKNREQAVLAARWLARSQIRNGPLEGAIPLNFDRGAIRAPWVSGLTQGLALSALARATIFTGDSDLRGALVAAVIPFERSVDQNGVASSMRGSVWYEECPDRDDPNHVLNGFIKALWGLRDVMLLDVCSTARELYERGVKGLADRLPDFDSGYWSYYRCPDRAAPRLASLYYHQSHAVSMRAMSRIENIPVFLDYADRWERYLAQQHGRLRVLANKIGDLPMA